jgi:hypothetical protein
MKIDDYFQKLLPLGGGPGTVSKVTLGLSTVPTSIDLHTLFGNLDGGQMLRLKAEGPVGPTASLLSWKGYFSLSAKAGTLANGASGLTPAASGLQAWPLADMEEFEGKLLSGRAQTFATSPSLPGFSTMLSHHVLNLSCSIGSGLMHVMRSTLPPSVDASQLRPPVGSAMFPPGPSGWVGPYV